MFVAVIIAISVLAATGSTTEAQKTAGRVAVTFRLLVHGHVGPHTTFWVAYGPLAGTFGVVRLHAAGQGWYTADRSLPAHGRTMVAYLAGVGSVVMPYGRAPGNPVSTIRTIGPVAASQLNGRVVQWDAPIG
jgi:hypothetical protein